MKPGNGSKAPDLPTRGSQDSETTRPINMTRRFDMKSLATVGAAIAALGLTSMPPAVVADTAVSLVGPRAEPVALNDCERCASLIRDGDADLVVTTTLGDGTYVAVWQSKSDNRVHGQRYTRDGQPRGAEFRINMEVADDGLLPVIITRPDGRFLAKWNRDGRWFEQHFDSQGAPLGREAQIK